jgi:hypothetical protein
MKKIIGCMVILQLLIISCKKDPASPPDKEYHLRFKETTVQVDAVAGVEVSVAIESNNNCGSRRV